jgi:membrane fusion protein (multidrug efflux system)
VEDLVVMLRVTLPTIVRSSHVARAARVVGAAGIVGALACGGQHDGAQPRSISTAEAAAAPLAQFTVDTATVSVPLELPAQLYVEHDAVVVARASGTVDSLYAELGEHVSAGALLARLESADQEIALSSARAAYDNLTRVAARSRALTASGGMTQADSEQVEFQLGQADIALRKAQRGVDLTRVTAPFDGVVTSRSARPRRFVAEGDTLFRVTELAPLFARIRVPEASARLLRVGERATVVGAGGAVSDATVARAAPIIDAASGTRELVLRVQHPRGELIAGASVVVRLGVAQRNALVVPRAAIAPDGYALVVDNGRSTVRPVTLGGDAGGGRIEVMSGLTAGERLARPPR